MVAVGADAAPKGTPFKTNKKKEKKEKKQRKKEERKIRRKNGEMDIMFSYKLLSKGFLVSFCCCCYVAIVLWFALVFLFLDFCYLFAFFLCSLMYESIALLSLSTS